MIVVGAKGFAKEVLEVLHQLNEIQGIAFYDDVNEDIGNHLYGKFPILKSEIEVTNFFSEFGTNFTIAIGNTKLRHKLFQKFQKLGGVFSSTISPIAQIGHYDVTVGQGCNILGNCTVSNSVVLGTGCIIYYNTLIAHDCIIGDFVELSPNATILGNVQIGEFTHIGANATILPGVKIGKNVVIGAGSVVTKDIYDNSVAVGIPAKIINKNPLGVIICS